jgi:hypothetical protein
MAAAERWREAEVKTAELERRWLWWSQSPTPVPLE